MKVGGFFDRLILRRDSRFQIQDSRFKRRAMGYKRFEELPVWQASIELALAT
jgi:hypothetical protein